MDLAESADAFIEVYRKVLDCQPEWVVSQFLPLTVLKLLDIYIEGVRNRLFY